MEYNKPTYIMNLAEGIEVIIDEIENNKLKIKIKNINQYNDDIFEIESSIKNIELIKNTIIKYININYNKKVEFIKLEKIEPAYYSN